MSEREEYEYDKNKLLLVIIIICVIIGATMTVIKFWPTQPIVINNIKFASTINYDQTEVDAKYVDFFGTTSGLENATLYKIEMFLTGLEFINKVSITVSLSEGIHLKGIVFTELMNEANTLHGKSDIPSTQMNYAATIGVVAMDYVLYLFCSNSGAGNLEYNIRAYGV